MKIYLFNPETGIYQGEDFADVPMRQGCMAVPPHATTIAPPSFSHGEVPVFGVAEKTWEIRPLSEPLTGAVPAPFSQASPMPQGQMVHQASREEEQ